MGDNGGRAPKGYPHRALPDRVFGARYDPEKDPEHPYFSEVDGWFDSLTKWKDTLSRIINIFILDQHDKVMYGKRRLDSCWLHRYENRVFKDQDYGPRYRSSRHRNVISILSDLNLLSVNKEKEVLMTTEGQLLLKKLLGNM